MEDCKGCKWYNEDEDYCMAFDCTGLDCPVLPCEVAGNQEDEEDGRPGSDF